MTAFPAIQYAPNRKGTALCQWACHKNFKFCGFTFLDFVLFIIIFKIFLDCTQGSCIFLELCWGPSSFSNWSFCFSTFELTAKMKIRHTFACRLVGCFCRSSCMLNMSPNQTVEFLLCSFAPLLNIPELSGDRLRWLISPWSSRMTQSLTTTTAVSPAAAKDFRVQVASKILTKVTCFRWVKNQPQDNLHILAVTQESNPKSYISWCDEHQLITSSPVWPFHAN